MITIAMMLRMLLRSFFMVMRGIQMMPVRQMRVLGRLGVITLVVMIRSQLVVLGSLLVVFRRFFMMVRDGVRLVCHGSYPAREGICQITVSAVS
ncbi:hypothetical protein [Dyella sp. ASV21]|uniref:hypothetical protein n=1 Tax=Dyella sp. ASV21 TaxID=2795114 RepID=UPI0018EA7ABB|nr:hypothetical protein [Dyella sp. ASV21]